MRQISSINKAKGILLIAIQCVFFVTTSFAQQPVTSITDYVIFGGTSAALPGQKEPASPGYGVIIGSSNSVKGSTLSSIGSYKLVQTTGGFSCGTTSIKTNIYSGGTIFLSNSNTIYGDIAAANAYNAAGTILSVGTSATLKGDINVKGNIVIGGGTVTGIVKNPTTNTYKLGSITKAGTGNPTLPVLPSMPAIKTFPSTGTTDNITATRTISPGYYGNLTLVGGSTVTLNGPGVYVFKSMNTSGPNNNIVYNFNSAVTGDFLIYVVGDVNLNKTSYTMTGGSASRIYTEVHGTGSTNSADTKAAFIMSNGSNGTGNQSGFLGALWVPYAAIKIGAPNGPSMTVNGSLWSGTQVNLLGGVNITYARYILCVPPTVNAGGAVDALCQGGTTGALGGSFGGGATSAVWSDGGAGGTFTNNTGSSPNTTIYRASASATATVTLTLTASGGTCGMISSSKTVTINPLPTVSVGGAVTAICRGGTTSALGGSFGGGATSALWSDGGAGGTFTNNTGSSPNTTTYTSSAASPAAVTLTLTTSGGSCNTIFASKTVTVNPLPSIEGTLVVCAGSATQLTGSGTPNVTNPWVSSNPLVATISNNGLVTGILAGTSLITFKNNNGCTNTTTVSVNALPSVISSTTINGLPVIVKAAGDDKPFNFDGITTLEGYSETPLVSYKWTAPAGGGFLTPDDQAIVNVTAPGIYSLELKSAQGCASTDLVEVSNKISSIIGSELSSLYWNNPTGQPSPFFIIKDGYVRIDIIVKVDRYDYVLALLQQTTPINYGLINIVTNGENGLGKKEIIITGDIPILNLLKLNALIDDINYCRPFYEPFTNSGIVTSAGDTTMRSNLVRSGYKIDGTGVKVGVISNSFATIQASNIASILVPFIDPTLPNPQEFTFNNLAQDLTNDDLPNNKVTILQDYPIKSTDEGRAMAQIVHDVAPGAEIYFRTGFFTAGDFATGIKALADAGCKVIVDDITYITEPNLKDGVVAQAVDEVKARGVTYFSAAGNFGNKSYEKDFTPVNAAANFSTPDAATVSLFTGKSAHNFAPTGSTDIFQHVTLEPGNYTIVLQWVDDIYSNGQFAGTKYDLDMFWTSNTNGTGLKGFNRDNRLGDPIEIMPFTINATTDANFLIINNTPGGNPVRIKYIIYRGNAKILEYDEGNSTLVGQANAAGAIAVGAARFDKAPPYLTTPLIESFSSIGGTTIFPIGGTSTVGEVRRKPDLVAPDGVNTMVKMGQDYPNNNLDGYSNFFGTSAAAPHAAAVAALIMEGKKRFKDQATTSSDEIRSLLQSTAIDMDAVGFDYISGYGLVNADAAMRTFAAPAATIIEVVVPATTVPCNGTPFTIIVTGENFSTNTEVQLISESGEITRFVPEFINAGEVRVTINSCVGNPGIRAYTPPKAGTNGSDGGYSNIKYFFSSNIIVTAAGINKKYGESMPEAIIEIKVDGVLLQNTNPLLTLQDIGLDKMTITNYATSKSDVGTYFVTPERIFDQTKPGDLALQKKYSYKFVKGLVSIAKMPLKVQPIDKTITYGQHIGDINFDYQFDQSNIANPLAFKDQIKASHTGFLPNNALAVIKDGLSLTNANLLNLNTMASFEAVKNSRRFNLVNNKLVPLSDPNATDIQYLVDISAQSILNYNANPSTATFINACQGCAGYHPKALISANSLANNTGTVTVNGSLVPMLNGSLVPMLNGQTGSLVPILNGSLVQILNGSLVQLLNGSLVPILNGSLVQLLNGSLVQILNGVPVPIVNGSLVQLLNGSLVQLLNGSLVQILNNNPVTIIDISTVSDVNALPNGSLVQLLNGSLVQLLNGSLVPLLNGSLVQMLNGSLVQILNGSLVQILNNNPIPIVNGNTVTDINAIPNGSLVQLLNGSLVQMLNGSLVQMLNGSLVPLLNGSLVQILNGTTQVGSGNSNSNTAVIIDEADGANQKVGPMFGINMITGLNAGTQTLVPGGLFNDNFEITYGLGKVNIQPTLITITPNAGQFKEFGDAEPVFTYTSSEALPQGNTFSGTLGRVPGETVATNAYAYTLGSLTAGGNYSLTLAGTNKFSIVNACNTLTHDPTNFVSTTKVATSLWLNLEVKLSGQLIANGDFLSFRTGTISFNNITSNPTITNLAIPNGRIVADNSVASPITNFDAGTNTWITRVPLGFSSTSDIFVTGAIINSSIGFTAKNNANSVVKGKFYSNKNFSDKWVYGMSAFQPQFGYGDIDAEGEVVSINGTYKAGTPLPVIKQIVNGGTGNGGNNLTGSPSNQNAFTACNVSNTLIVGRSANSPLNAPVAFVRDLYTKGQIYVAPNPASDFISLSFVPVTTGISQIALFSVDGRKVFEINNGVCKAGEKYTRQIDVSKMQRGVYLIQLISADKITTKRIIITR